MRETKIIGTIGPASNSYDVMKKLVTVKKDFWSKKGKLWFDEEKYQSWHFLFAVRKDRDI